MKGSTVMRLSRSAIFGTVATAATVIGIAKANAFAWVIAPMVGVALLSGAFFGGTFFGNALLPPSHPYVGINPAYVDGYCYSDAYGVRHCR
jgi:hypothetical protein